MQSSLTVEKVNTLLFDVDGTLMDSIEMVIAGLGDAFEKYGSYRPTRSEIAAQIGKPLTDQMFLFGCSPENDEELEEMISYTLTRYEAHAHLESEFNDAVEALILAKRKGLKIALITSRNHVELGALKRHFRAWDSVDLAICASDVTSPKPAPESIFLALEKLGEKPENAVMIGDSTFDLRCGNSAGVRTAACLYGAGKANHLLAEAPSYVLDTPADLLEWVHNLIEQRENATEENHTH